MHDCALDLLEGSSVAIKSSTFELGLRSQMTLFMREGVVGDNHETHESTRAIQAILRWAHVGKEQGEVHRNPKPVSHEFARC